ncbi:MAG: hypothetical protein IH623_15460 [Verrucomicrobia bacterium]|nr:hypothetical protein [Verrucomicrobiota bacterium]
MRTTGHWLTGIQIVELIDNNTQSSMDKDPKFNPFSTRCMEENHALQLHAGPPRWAEYKNIRIKALNKQHPGLLALATEDSLHP